MNTIIQLIVCPWCYSTIEALNHAEEYPCPICQRVITEEDIENAMYKDH